VDSNVTKLLTQEMRKLEKQARQLLYKMDKLTADWDRVKAELKKNGKDIPHQLGDLLSGWKRRG